MMPAWKERAHQGGTEIAIIAHVLKGLAVAAVSCSTPLDGAVIEWLAQRLDEAQDRIELALTDAPGGAA